MNYFPLKVGLILWQNLSVLSSRRPEKPMSSLRVKESSVALLGSAAAFSWHVSLRRALHGELEVVTLHMGCFFGK